jgi:hypothetical protein
MEYYGDLFVSQRKHEAKYKVKCGSCKKEIERDMKRNSGEYTCFDCKQLHKKEARLAREKAEREFVEREILGD